MTTKNIEKVFKIEVVASLLENRLLNTNEYKINEDELYELCSFVSGINIDKTNFYHLGNKVKNIILELHPELNIRINRTKDHLYEINFLYEVDIKAILFKYRNLFGDNYSIKSLNKCLVKTLEIQDK